MGSTLFLLLGAGPAAIGLAAALLLQAIFFAPLFGMNVTTLLVPLFALAALARRLIPLKTLYVDLRYGQALALSTAYQAGIVSWVAFRAFYGQDFTATNAVSIGTFGGAYMLVIIVEPLIDLAVLAVAKGLNDLRGNRFVNRRLFALD